MTAYDVAIIGGAVHGASAAYHLAASGFGGRIVLIEKDPAFRYAATALSAGSIRQQFSTAINIEISLYGVEFLKNIGTLLAVDGERPEIGLDERRALAVELFVDRACGGSAVRDRCRAVLTAPSRRSRCPVRDRHSRRRRTYR